jgi:hypothetical protein
VGGFYPKNSRRALKCFKGRECKFVFLKSSLVVMAECIRRVKRD